MSWRRLLRHGRGGQLHATIVEPSLAPIVHTPPMATERLIKSRLPDAPIGIHILAQDAQAHLATWAVKSFYHFAGVRYPLTVHMQGPLTRELQSIFSHHFPHARLITQKEADRQVEPWLRSRGFHRLLHMRRQLFLMMKLIDLRLFARTPRVLYFDSDVLFFQRPCELLSMPSSGAVIPHLFMRDDYPSYCLTPEEAHADLGIDLAPFANTGLMRLEADGIDLAACERFMAHSALAQKHWHLEQTLHALNASAQGRVALLPGTYAMSKGLETESGPIARHYVSPIRPLFVQEGIARLLESGFLEALRAAPK